MVFINHHPPLTKSGLTLWVRVASGSDTSSGEGYALSAGPGTKGRTDAPPHPIER